MAMKAQQKCRIHPVVSHATHSTGVGKGLILFPGAILTCFSALGTQPALLDHSSQNMFSASLLDHRNEDTTAESHNHTIPGFCGFPPPFQGTFHFLVVKSTVFMH